MFRGDLEIEAPPEDAVVIDLRPRSAYDRWHLPGALWLDFLEAQKAWSRFDRKQSYLLCCEVGLKSAHLAELMHDAGYEAYNLKGGLARFRRREDAGASPSDPLR
jgi:thiamine biosynthesis protein ThiI